MIQKSDILLLLTELQNNGEDVEEEIDNLYKTNTIPIDTLQLINNKKPLDLIMFYEKLRKSYNHKRSKLYGNIVKSDENATMDAKTILTTLSAMLNQILQFDPDDKPMFLKHSRSDEITKVLAIYFDTFNIKPAYELLKLIKADLIVSEYINGRRS